tara:strand:+ start:32 stop:199 length:168 start_codon:yes stop_codon:yes gene_type:complete
MIILNDEEKVEFFSHDDVHEIKEHLIHLGLPVSGIRKTISIRLYDALYAIFWSGQ